MPILHYLWVFRGRTQKNKRPFFGVGEGENYNIPIYDDVEGIENSWGLINLR